MGETLFACSMGEMTQYREEILLLNDIFCCKVVLLFVKAKKKNEKYVGNGPNPFQEYVLANRVLYDETVVSNCSANCWSFGALDN